MSESSDISSLKFVDPFQRFLHKFWKQELAFTCCSVHSKRQLICLKGILFDDKFNLVRHNYEPTNRTKLSKTDKIVTKQNEFPE